MAPLHPPKPAVRFIFITLVLDVLGLGLIIPVAPRLVEQLSGGNEATAGPLVGLLGATYAAMQFLFAPLLGSLSDRYGRRPVILISLLGSGLDYLALAIAPNLAWLFIARAINGLSGANITAAAGYIADVTPPEKRAAGFGMIGAAFGLGFVIGPAMGGILGEYGIRIPFIVAGVLTLINWLYGCFVLPESLPPEKRRKTFNWKRANPAGSLLGLRRYPIVFGLAWAIFLLNLAQYGLHATWVLYTKYRYDWSSRDVGLSLMVVGLCAAAVQGGLARRVIPMLGERRAMLIGFAIAVLAYIGYGAATAGWVLYAVIVIGSLGAIGQPAGQGLISRTVGADEQGEIQGGITSLVSVAGVVGPILGGTVFGYFIGEHRPLAEPLPGAPFFVSAMLAAAGLAVAAVTFARTSPALAEEATDADGVAQVRSKT